MSPEFQFKFYRSNYCSQTTGTVPPPPQERQINSSKRLDVIIYPNPNNGNFFIQLPNIIDEPVIASLYDIRGTLIKSFTLKEQLTEVRDLNLVNGMYLLHIKQGEAQSTHKIVKCD